MRHAIEVPVTPRAGAVSSMDGRRLRAEGPGPTCSTSPHTQPVLAQARQRARAARRDGDLALACELARRTRVFQQAVAYERHLTRNILVPATLTFLDSMSAVVSKLEAAVEPYRSGLGRDHGDDAPESGPMLRPPWRPPSPTQTELNACCEQAMHAIVIRGHAQRSLQRLTKVPSQGPRVGPPRWR